MRRDLLRNRVVAAALRRRGPQVIVTLAALAGLIVAIVAGLAGTPVGARNAGIVLVWIAWWGLLMLVAVPIAGRGWCSVCPVPAIGEWLQRGAVLGPHGPGLGANRRWPRALRNIWLQSAGFVLVSLFGVVVLFKACIMLGSALAYAAVMLGPWGGLKSAASAVGTAAWWAYAAAFVLLVLVALPGALWLATAAGGRLAASAVATRRAFPRFARALTPLGLAAWVVFTLSFASANLSYVWPVLSDPLGWGWNLLGTADLAWRPYGATVLPFLQTGVLLGGLAWTGAAVRHVAADLEPQRSVVHRAAPVLSLVAVLAVVFMELLVA